MNVLAWILLIVGGLFVILVALFALYLFSNSFSQANPGLAAKGLKEQIGAVLIFIISPILIYFAYSAIANGNTINSIIFTLIAVGFIFVIYFVFSRKPYEGEETSNQTTK